MKYLAKTLLLICLIFTLFALPAKVQAASCDPNSCNCNATYASAAGQGCHPGDCTISASTGPGISALCAPPRAIASPNNWLQYVNPGFGPNPSLGLSFFTSNVPTFVISVLVFVLIIASLIFLLYGGILWITSSGDKEAMAKARNTIMYAVIGLVLGILSFAFINILGTFLHINLIGS